MVKSDLLWSYDQGKKGDTSTLVELNLSVKYKNIFSIFYHFSTLTWYRSLKTFSIEDIDKDHISFLDNTITAYDLAT